MYAKTCIRRRWKGCSEFLFWGCFSYEKKGPFHIWKTETAKEKREAQIELDKLNETLESEAKENWELETSMRRMKLRNPGGRKLSGNGIKHTVKSFEMAREVWTGIVIKTRLNS